MNVSISDLELI